MPGRKWTPLPCPSPLRPPSSDFDAARKGRGGSNRRGSCWQSFGKKFEVCEGGGELLKLFAELAVSGDGPRAREGLDLPEFRALPVILLEGFECIDEEALFTIGAKPGVRMKDHPLLCPERKQ